jgi:hypothetical protein
LVYDGTAFYNTYLDTTDDQTKTFYPLTTDASDVMYYTGSAGRDVKKQNNSGTVYKGATDDKNYLILSQFDSVSGVDKLAYSTTVLFAPLVTGQSIEVEYLLGELTSSASWSALGTASYTLDGGSVTEKTFLFGDAVLFKKIWFRVKLQSAGTDTPTVNDIVTAYLPMPVFKKTWTLNINAADDLRRLDGQLVEKTGRELKSLLEIAWWTKSILDFQDVDYASTAIDGSDCTASATTITVDSTHDSPEQGRIRIEDEEIFYTSKTPTTFVGCTRGARSTRAIAHANNTVVNNAYKVLITDMQTRAPIMLEDKELEWVVNISLKEA